MSCQCYQVGGPFIAEDPDCPAHGTQARIKDLLRDQESEDKDARITALELRVKKLEEMLGIAGS